MRLDVWVEEGKGRVPSEIGTEPDRVGISDFIDGQTRGAVGSSGALSASSKVSVVEVDRFTAGRAKAAAVEIRELRAQA